MRSVVIIPARYASSRFPGKPLTHLLGKPMIQWVAELSARAVGQENVYVATDDLRIADVASASGFQVVMTNSQALTGTDRLAEAAKFIDADIYVNVQGDEPLVDPADIMRVIDAKRLDMNRVINGYCWLSEDEDPADVNIPKVLTTETGSLIYMSRSTIPGHKTTPLPATRYKKQVCIYAFTADQLNAFAEFGRKSEVEQCEDIEILRFLELGTPVQMVETSAGSLAVDRLEDIDKVERALRKRAEIGHS